MKKTIAAAAVFLLTSGAMATAADMAVKARSVLSPAPVSSWTKTAALFAEFRETGVSEQLGYQSSDDLRAAYPSFFWKAVRPYVGDALVFARHSGRQAVDRQSLRARVFRRAPRSTRYQIT